MIGIWFQLLTFARMSSPSSTAKAVSLPIQKCKVSFVDRRGVFHSVEVQASTVFEAVCRASAIFKHSVVEDPTWAAEFIVEVREQPKLYRVKTEEMRRWLSSSGRSPKEHMERNRLQGLLDSDI
jgi:hypothetical protein